MGNISKKFTVCLHHDQELRPVMVESDRVCVSGWRRGGRPPSPTPTPTAQKAQEIFESIIMVPETSKWTCRITFDVGGNHGATRSCRTAHGHSSPLSAADIAAASSRALIGSSSTLKCLSSIFHLYVAKSIKCYYKRVFFFLFCSFS